MKCIAILTAVACAALPVVDAEVPTDFQSRFLAIGLSRSAPAFARFSVDSLGQGKTSFNPVLDEGTNMPTLHLAAGGTNRFLYLTRSPDSGAASGWSIECGERNLRLRSQFRPGGDPAPPFALAFNQKSNHATLLGLMRPGQRQMPLPCVLHLPDMGSVRITGTVPGWHLDYDARRYVKTPFVRVAFPSATAARPEVEYHLDVVAIHPPLAGIETNALFDGFRRDYLNLFQINPRVQMLANNASSDPVPFTLFKYAEMARHAPPLAEGLSCLDLVRLTLDRYLAGAKGYGQVGYGAPSEEADLVAWKAPWTSLDTYPSLLIAAGLYIQGAEDWTWARVNYVGLSAWGREMLRGDNDGNGLIEYPGTGNFGDRPTGDRRPANWWDCINFGHEDAYSNALAYRACVLMAEVAGRLEREGDAEWFRAAATKLRAAYVPTFLNPATGVLAGWRSADGQLHDYWFTFVSGVAISYGLVEPTDANAILDRLLRQLRDVGYTQFRFGLPGNLVPIRKGDYVLHNWPNARDVGEPSQDDGSDAFQLYENGGATGCYAYYTLKALYNLGRGEEARRILHPMLASYAAGEFQGFCDTGKSKDWRDWAGGCHGYEGLLVDNYLPLLAVLDEWRTVRPPWSGR